MVRNIVSRAMFKCCICGQAIAFGLKCFQSLDKPMDHYHTSCYEKTAMNRIESGYNVEKRSVSGSWINLSRIFRGWWGDVDFVYGTFEYLISTGVEGTPLLLFACPVYLLTIITCGDRVSSTLPSWVWPNCARNVIKKTWQKRDKTYRKMYEYSALCRNKNLT